MNALNDLTAEVKFRERMRGYDYEEVDDYVKTVKRVATLAKDQVAELQQRVAQLESQAGNDDGAAEIRETLLRTLVLAQRTADSAVSEARSEAKSIVESAKERAAKTVAEAEAAADERLRSSEERAARLLADGEENSQLIIAEAKRTAAAELATERARASEEIEALEATKAELATSLNQIQSRLDEERNVIRSLAVSLQSFVAKFEPVGGVDESGEEPEAAATETRGTQDTDETEEAHDPIEAEAGTDETGEQDEAAEAGTDETAEPGEPTEAGTDQTASGGAPAVDERDEQEPPGGSSLEFLPEVDGTATDSAGTLGNTLPNSTVAAETVPDLPVIGWDDGVEDEPYADATTPEPLPVEATRAQSEPLPVEATRAQSEPLPVEATRAQSEPAPGGNGSAGREPVDSEGDASASPHAPTMPFAIDSPELFDMDAEEDDEFIEQLRQVVSSDAPLPDTDAAMAAFFNQDADAGTGSGASGRGGRLGPRA